MVQVCRLRAGGQGNRPGPGCGIGLHARQELGCMTMVRHCLLVGLPVRLIGVLSCLSASLYFTV